LGFTSDFWDFRIWESQISTEKLSNGFPEGADMMAQIHFGNPTLEVYFG
jgi:hypothetical protein